MSVMHITKANYDELVKNSDKPVLLDFWAEWCGPCRMLAPIVDEIANEYKGKVNVGKVNVDDERELAMRYGISSIPTLMLFKNGEVVKKSVGYAPKSELEEMLRQH